MELDQRCGCVHDGADTRQDPLTYDASHMSSMLLKKKRMKESHQFINIRLL